MKLRLFTLLTFLFLLSSCSFSEKEANVLILKKCPKIQPCLYSQLVSGDYSFTKNVVIKHDKSFRYYTFLVNATKYGKNKVKQYTLQFSSGRNASCGFFQNARLPLAGLSELGNPVVYTQQGKYELFFDTKKTTIGCKTCISQIDDQGVKLKSFYSPVKDFYAYNYRLHNFSLSKKYSGILFRNLNKCLLISSTDLLKEVNKSLCKSYQNVGNNQQNFNNLVLGIGDFIYQDPDDENILLHIEDKPCEN